MLVRLSSAGRLVAARLLALAYLFCVLAPALSFAWADGARAAPCVTEDQHGMRVVHVHEHVTGAAQHVHPDGHSHDHSALVAASEAGYGAGTVAQPISPAGDHHKSAGGQCCGMVCVSALPATLTDIVRPAAPRSVCVSANYRAIADNTPPQHYRPPIA
ncbi:MAG: hypothetical protein EKK33_07305 [Bradyrhizobiaceae bacterium]|nr:MAG: hypothetical protein EKK33_07305 [Bradyrhizobiaceae bacterium]